MEKPEDTPDCCQGVDDPCDGIPAWRRQNTAYCDEIKNWVNMCDSCFAYTEQQWKEQWSDLHAELHADLDV